MATSKWLPIEETQYANNCTGNKKYKGHQDSFDTIYQERIYAPNYSEIDLQDLRQTVEPEHSRENSRNTRHLLNKHSANFIAQQFKNGTVLHYDPVPELSAADKARMNVSHK